MSNVFPVLHTAFNLHHFFLAFALMHSPVSPCDPFDRNDRSILLIDDNPDDRELTLLAFESLHLGHQVRVAQDGAEALDFLFGAGPLGPTGFPLPKMILLDLNLPRMNGLEVLQRIRTHEATRLLPVVILTTSTEHRDLVQSYSLGCNSYIRKPVDFEQFQEAIRQLSSYWLLLNQVPPLTLL
jgi:two-component system, response regulator